MTLMEYAAALGRSRKPGDAEVSAFILSNRAKLRGWLSQFSLGMNRDERDELLQACLLAIVEVVRGLRPETGRKNKARESAEAPGLKDVRNAIERHSEQNASWKARRTSIPNEES